MSRTICYVDGLNLYHAISELQAPHLKGLDLWTLAQSFVTTRDELRGVIYFTAVADWIPEKARRHRKYIAALRARGVEVVLSRFQKVMKPCRSWSRSCPFHEEKETDVALASRVLSDALTGAADKQIIVTADADQLPMLRQVRAACPHIHLTLAIPPGRATRVRALCAEVSRHVEIHPTRLGGCLLPRNVSAPDGKVIATCPAEYSLTAGALAAPDPPSR